MSAEILAALSALLGALLLWSLRAARRAVTEGAVQITIARRATVELQRDRDEAVTRAAAADARAASCAAHVEQWQERAASLLDRSEKNDNANH
jgi:hypothetical protein